MSPILYIDPGSIKTGYAWREDSRIISGVIAVRDKTPVPSRLRLIRSELAGIIESEDNPLFKQLVIEIPVAHAYSKRQGMGGKSKNIASLFILSRAVGVIQEVCEAHDMGVIEVKATEWTQGFPKDYRCSGASQIADKRVKDDNEADAICLLDYWERIGQHGH